MRKILSRLFRRRNKVEHNQQTELLNSIDRKLTMLLHPSNNKVV